MLLHHCTPFSTLLIYATTTFSAGFQMFSNSSTAASGAVLGFQRQNGAAAVTSGFVLGSILFSGYDGSVEGTTAQIRSVFTVSLLRFTLLITGLLEDAFTRAVSRSVAA